MRNTTQHLNDEHMQLYEWSGTGAGITLGIPARSKRTHPWHASYAVLAVLTTLLILNGCDSKSPAGKAGEQVDAQDMKQEPAPLKDGATPPPEIGDKAAPEAGDKAGPQGGDMQKQ